MHQTSSKAINYLTLKKIPFVLFTHTQNINSIVDAADQRGQTIDQVLRSILFRNKNHDFFMVITTGSKRVNWKKLRNYLGVNRTTLATESEVLAETGYQLGTVNPFNINPEIRVFINKSCLTQSSISIGSGLKGIAIILSIENLIKALPDLIIVDFSD
jgi:Cys-tRNA(Pro) deacylase